MVQSKMTYMYKLVMLQMTMLNKDQNNKAINSTDTHTYPMQSTESAKISSLQSELFQRINENDRLKSEISMLKVGVMPEKCPEYSTLCELKSIPS